jgi:hypothetical protein
MPTKGATLMTSHFYFRIRQRAIELLQSGFEGKSLEEIKSGESWFRRLAISEALRTAVQEVQTQQASWLAQNNKRVVLLRNEHSKLLTEIRRIIQYG